MDHGLAPPRVDQGQGEANVADDVIQLRRQKDAEAVVAGRADR